MALRYPKPPLADAEVMLRPWQDSDVSLLERASADDYVATIEHLPVPVTKATGRQWIAAQAALASDERGWSFAIVQIATGEPVGGVGVSFRHPPGVAEPGAWIIEGKRNLGLAERAVRLLCHWALANETGIARLQATVEPWNVASQRVLDKLGFVREGLLRSYASWHGDRQDVILYSLLASDSAITQRGEADLS